MEETMSSKSVNSGARRRILIAGGACLTALHLNKFALAAGEERSATPECRDQHDATPRQMEGPFFKPRSPERISLLDAGVQGTRIVITGVVLSTSCRPLPGALLDFWQCDDRGNYDNRGNTLRGHQFSDAQGRYRLESIVPGLYPGRTRHIHVKVQAPNQPVLTTQLYFPNEPQNAEDFLFRPELLVALNGGQDPRSGHFDFVVKAS
jgi:protocatechuate 3,4-dioxygenase beta subunit